MSLPRISVVTPSFNQGQYLEMALRSVLDQGYPNLELIVMDGGSTDESKKVLERYAPRLDHWESQPDNGQTDALAKGFERSTGDILCWLCSDDLHKPWTLHQVAEFFVANPGAQVVYGDAEWIDGGGRLLKPKKEHHFNRFIWMYDYNYLPQPSTFWRRELYETVGGLDPAFDLAMDADLWARFQERTRLFHVQRIWSQMRLYREQKNQRLRRQSDAEDRQIRERYIGDEPRWSRLGKKMLAKGIRIGWKLSTGCYW